MRFAGLGLVTLLVGFGIYMMIQAFYTVPLARKGLEAEEKAAQIAGQDLTSGMKTTDSITFDAQFSGSRLKGIIVTSIVAGGPMETHFGLMAGDVITDIKETSLDATANNDAEMAKAEILEAYQRQHNLVVDRPGVGKIELPRDKGTIAPAGTVMPGGTGGSSAAPMTGIPMH